MRAVATLLAFAASALAISVTQPTNSTGWSTSGSNTVAWNAVSSDPKNFTVVLVNMNKFPNYSQVLDALVVTSDGKASVNPPSSGWPSGSGFQVNLVADAQNLNSILAQSDQFSFVTPSGSSSVSVSSTSGSSASSGSTGGTMTVPAASQSTSGASGSSGSSGSDLNPTSSDTATTPTNSNAAVATGVQATFFGLVALVGAMLA